MGAVHSAKVMGLFLDRIRGELAANNTLRGPWVEEMVAAFIGITDFPGAWSYFDLRDHDGRSISIKQSVGSKAKFDVSGRRNAWDNELAVRQRLTNPKAEGWLENPTGEARRWCDLFIFGILPGDLTSERVTDVDEWRFAVRTRAELDALPIGTKSMTVRRLGVIGATFKPGIELRAMVDASGS